MKTITADRPTYKSVTTLKRYRIQGLTEDQWLTMGSELMTKDDAIHQIKRWELRMPATFFRIKEIITMITETEVEYE
jgi:hypothetical protein